MFFEGRQGLLRPQGQIKTACKRCEIRVLRLAPPQAIADADISYDFFLGRSALNRRAGVT
jgi:hypothetical protein